MSRGGGGTKTGGQYVTPHQLGLLRLLRGCQRATLEQLASWQRRPASRVRTSLDALVRKGLALEEPPDAEGVVRWRAAASGEVRRLDLAHDAAARVARVKAGERVAVPSWWLVYLDSEVIRDGVWPVSQRAVQLPVPGDRALLLTQASRVQLPVPHQAGDLLVCAAPHTHRPASSWVVAEDKGIERVTTRAKAEEQRLPVTSHVLGVWRTIGGGV